ncbi:MAG: exosortase/archaeosortase family protein [Armatimonadota bacterium]|nr:exosortase/archaeosortase family protein [bacterium]MCS7309007.1 exosortase/archaeosortase family protein [Armatimonadota bacterium]MDW8103438.1 exosortase/archaeosortase family protein [Armatimonadota bacterium]MDW8289582.1 exosortase/archaeosortase family protein [Armatimonadota bacterium]
MNEAIRKPNLWIVKQWLPNPVLWMGVGLVVTLFIAYYSLFVDWKNKWFEWTGYYSHGVLVPFLAAYMVWMRREELRRAVPRPSLWAFALIVPALLLRLLGHIAPSSTLSSFSFLMLVYGITAAIWGWNFVRLLWFPILFLGFMMPLPGVIFDEISQPAQDWSTTVADTILRTVGYETRRVGNFIYIPGGFDLDVGVPCSGFKMVVSMATFAAFFAYYIGTSLGRQAILVISAIPIAIAINGLRIALIGMVGTKWGEAAGLKFHDWSGYLVLVVAFAVLFQIGRMLGWRR